MQFRIRGYYPLWLAFLQTILLSLSLPLLTCSVLEPESDHQADYCGPATPDSPFESPGLGCSDFARHYFRNHGCFLFLWVLRWFTSPGSLHTPMNSAHDSRCSHRLDFSIRKSPDHRMLASPRGLSQLATSFIAFLRQGIPTHALSSLTIKFTHNTEQTHGPRGRVHGRQRIIERLSYSIRSPPAALIYDQSIRRDQYIDFPIQQTGTNLCSARQYSVVKQHSLRPSGLRKSRLSLQEPRLPSSRCYPLASLLPCPAG